MGPDFSSPEELLRELLPFCLEPPRTLVSRGLTAVAQGGWEERERSVADGLGKTSELSSAVWGLYT